MAVSTYQHGSLTGTPRERGFLARIGDKIVAARAREADRAVAAYLLSLDDETLKRLGYDRDTLLERDPKGYPFL